MTLADRVADKIEIVGDCWLFTGQRNKGGYGRIRVGSRRQVVAHRVMYEHFVGPVPEGLELDHVCGNPGCVNPDHLEAVTHSENVRRYRARATHCPNGHPYGDVPAGERKCPVCRRKAARERQRRYIARKREMAA